MTRSAAITKKKPRSKRIQYLIMIDGQIIDQTITDNIVNAARRGLITEAGKNTFLIPDRRGEFRDKGGIRFKGFGRVKQSDCIPLYSFCPLGKATKSPPAITEKVEITPRSTGVPRAVSGGVGTYPLHCAESCCGDDK